MATIKDTLDEIPVIQEELKTLRREKEGCCFIQELTSFTTILYFNYLPHVILDYYKNTLPNCLPNFHQYYELINQEGLLDHYVRLNNIGQYSIAWNTYEKYLREKAKNEYSLNDFRISNLFEKLIKKVNPLDKEKLIEEFDVMRHTRNSLHDGGIYGHRNPFSGCFCGKLYTFKKDEAVVPLRVIDVVKTCINHYKKIEKL